MQALDPFQNQKYLNLETFRRNGVGVKTPIWFAQDRDALYTWWGCNLLVASPFQLWLVGLDGDLPVFPIRAATEAPLDGT